MKQDNALNLALLILRIFVGGILLYYGLQKLLGLFGGGGFMATIEGFQGRGIPPLFGALAIFAESFGALGVAVGLLTRVAALGVASTMAVAAWTKVPELDINSMQAMGAFFYPLALMGMALTVLVAGAGHFSLDYAIFGKRKGKAKAQ